MTHTRLSISDLNAGDQARFVAALGFVFEGSPWIAEQAWAARPFTDVAHLHQALCAVMYAAPVERQIALIAAHPDLAGKAAIAGTLTAESTREQASVGLDRLSPAEFASFTQLNDAYRARFGFPFVICVRQQTKDSILAAFAARLEHTRSQEIVTALDEIAQIAHLRLHDIVQHAG
jgi:OHCU decarboxylase